MENKMQYDIATKVVMEQGGASLIESFLGITVQEFKLIEELPQESVSLKRSDYLIKAKTPEGKLIIAWEFLSVWKERAILNLLDYTVRAKLKFKLPVIPVVLYLGQEKTLHCPYVDKYIIFRYRLVRINGFKAREFLDSGNVYVMPFVPLMDGGGNENVVIEAEEKIYNSQLDVAEKADLLT